MKKKAVLFDMDGVLVDSEAVYAYFVVEFFEHFNQKVDRKKLRKIAGADDYNYYKILGDMWNPKKTSPEMKEFYDSHIFHDKLDFTKILNPHVRFMLEKLKEKGYKIGLASSSPMDVIMDMAISNKIDSYFDVIMSGCDLEKSKPDPMIYFEVMKRLQVHPEECIIIEDSNYGIQAGKASGAYVIAKEDHRFGFVQDVADYIASDLLDAYLQIVDIERKEEEND